MNKILLFVTLVVLLSSFNIYAQPYSIGETNITFTDPARANRSIPTAIFYPAANAGTNATPAAGQHCLVVFGHGFLILYTQYAWLANALVPQGYIVAFPDTETGFPSHGDFGDDIAFLVSAIQAEGANASSILFGAVSPNSAVGGHSMGGGASFLAADGNASINALFNFAAAETNPSAIAAAANVLVPTLVFEGTDDCVTPSAGNTGDMYSSLNTSCQTLVSITGASHCQFANSDFVCGLGQIGCGGNISQGAQENEAITYLLPFLNYHLKDDCDEGTAFDNLITNPTGSTTQSNCNVPSANCNSCAAVDLNILFDGFPPQTSWQITDNANNNVVATSPRTTLVSGGGGFGASESNSFCLTGGLAPRYGNDNIKSSQKNGLGNDEISIYPNPVVDVLMIEFPFNSSSKNVVVNVFDMNGKLLVEQNIQNESGHTFELNVAGLDTGNYRVIVVGEKGGVYDAVFVKR